MSDELAMNREPLLSDEEATSLRSDIDSVALRVRDWYEDKITSGELRVVRVVGLDEHGQCKECGCFHEPMGIFCTYCGQQVKS